MQPVSRGGTHLVNLVESNSLRLPLLGQDLQYICYKVRYSHQPAEALLSHIDLAESTLVMAAVSVVFP